MIGRSTLGAFGPLAAVTAILALATAAAARNVDLSTVPTRQSVQLTIYNSEDLTLVRETRKVTFKRGSNPLQFSWAGTRIDPTSVQLEFLTNPDRLEVVDKTFPHDRPQLLYWNVESQLDGEAEIEITYFTSGITWSADYLVIAGSEETAASVESFVRVTNHSGEEYENAQVRLVVGTINLVEQMARLAGVQLGDVNRLEWAMQRDLRNTVAKDMLGRYGGAAGAAREPTSAPAKPKEIIKEGLSEYFIYTIEGRETIPDRWSKRLRSFEAKAVPLAIEYRYRPAQYGDQLVRMYLMTNNEKSKLGSTPLPDGMVRVFRRASQDRLSFLAQQSIKYVPVGDKIELNLGADPRVQFELVKLKASRDNIWLRLGGGDIYYRADSPEVRFEPRATVAGWDDHELYSQRVRNYSDRAIKVEVRRSFTGDVLFRSGLMPRLHDYRTVEFHANLVAGAKRDLLFEIARRQGRNQKQNRVELASASLEP